MLPTTPAETHLASVPAYREGEKEIWTSSPEELADVVLNDLKQAGVQTIEWRAALHRRMGVPVMLTDYYYLILDAELENAASIVSKTGLPLISPPTILTETSGVFYTLGHHFRLTSSSAIAALQMLVLFPSSFALFGPSELELKDRYTSLSSPLCKQILVPRPPAVFASIIRAMLRYPRWSATRTTLNSDLEQLIGYHLYELYDGYVNADDEAACEELQVDQKVEDGAALVRTWRCIQGGDGGGWRDEEEWMLDLLYWVVCGLGDIEHIPWASS